MYFFNVDLTQQSTKLLITEDVPLNAYYMELVCKLVYLKVEVLYAGFFDSKKV